MLLETKSLEETIELTLATPYVADAVPVSLLIIAKPESGKTHALREYEVNKGVLLEGDVTYSGLIDFILPKVEQGTVKTVILTELCKIYGRNVNVAKNFITLLNEAIEEGIRRIAVFGRGELDFQVPVRFNVIAAVTNNELFSHMDMMGQVGFLNRVVPFSYAYTKDQVDKIFETIMERRDTVESKKLKLGKPRKIRLERNCAQRLHPIVEKLVSRYQAMIGDSTYGFRYQRNLQTLSCASAYLEGAKTVSTRDVEKIERLSRWFNFDLNPLEEEGGQHK